MINIAVALALVSLWVFANLIRVPKLSWSILETWKNRKEDLTYRLLEAMIIGITCALLLVHNPIALVSVLALVSGIAIYILLEYRKASRAFDVARAEIMGHDLAKSREKTLDEVVAEVKQAIYLNPANSFPYQYTLKKEQEHLLPEIFVKLREHGYVVRVVSLDNPISIEIR